MRSCIECGRPLRLHPNPACSLTEREAIAEAYDLTGDERNPEEDAEDDDWGDEDWGDEDDEDEDDDEDADDDLLAPEERPDRQRGPLR